MTRRIVSLLLVFLFALPALAQEPPPEGVGPRRPRRRPGRQAEPTEVPKGPTQPAQPTPAPAAPGVPPAVGPAATPPATGAPIVAPPPVGTEAPGEDVELYKCKTFKASDKIKVTLKPDTDLKDLVAWVMGFTCKSFIFGNAISGRANKVTMIAPSEMTPPEAYRLFLVALQTMNLTVVPKGRTLEIAESQRGREMPIPVYRSGSAVPGQDQVVRVVLRPTHVSVDELSQVVNAMKTTLGTVNPIPNAGVLLITDYGSVIDKMMDVIKDVDVPTGADRIYIIYLQNADAKDVAQKLNDIFNVGRTGGGAPSTPAPNMPPQPQMPGQPPQPRTRGATGGGGGGGGSAVPTKIIPDDRTNSLIVIASERAYERILALVRRLDTAAGGETGTIHVYNLANADAEALAGTMNTLITGQAPRQTQPGGRERPVAAPPQAAVSTGQGAAAAGAFEGAIKLTHDKPTNSLVIVSSAKDFYSLREVIKRLDKPRRQVFVEATIVEVTLNKTRKVGFAYHGGAQYEYKNANDTTVFTGVESKQLSSLSTNPATLDGLIAGVIGPQLLGLSIPSLGVLFQLVQNNSDVNVLSSPNILTTDNEAAEISIGQNIPYLSTTLSGANQLAGLAGQAGQQQGQTTVNNPLLGFGGFGQSIQRQDVALTLKLTPHVSESDSIRLEVDLEISDVLDPNFGGNGPSWSKRKVKTPIVVRDQQPVVIGGLMASKDTVTETKVPLLGDIPLLGYLFKYQEKQKIKTNLLIFLTPYIIKDQSDVQRIFEQKVSERREFIRSYSTFQDQEFEIRVDYRRKRGLVEEMNKAIQSADEDERLLEEAQSARQRLGQEGPVELPSESKGGGDENPPEGTPPPVPPPPQPEE